MASIQNGTPDIMTPDQAAEYLQISRETIYRYIRNGKLVASRLGRSYRIPRRNLDLLLWESRTDDRLPLREYSQADVATFLTEDELDAEAEEIARRFAAAYDLSSRR